MDLLGWTGSIEIEGVQYTVYMTSYMNWVQHGRGCTVYMTSLTEGEAGL